MLKIKDNVDLKELEKFGYEEYDEGLNEPYIIYRKYIRPYISIDILPNRTITKNNDDSDGFVKKENIQDLIQAELVEKVEEN